MKSFALTLFATTVLGAVRQTQVIDLTDLTQLKESYNMETGEAIKFQLRENPSTGFTWEIEEQNGLRVSDTYESGPARKPGLLGQT